MEGKSRNIKDTDSVASDNKVYPWPVRVDNDTRLLIKQAAKLEGKKLEDFFGTTIKAYCQVLISEAQNSGKFTNINDYSSLKKVPLVETYKVTIKKLFDRIVFRIFGPDSKV